MRQPPTIRPLEALASRAPTEVVQDTLGALSLCVTFVAILFLPGLF
ncbi:hypothetical protein [Rhodobacter lacus]|uniref:Uncharacterized protein n=1 Tax=Rhodobacter lacus TaxID=1641972 RepID=A0ABW5AAG1_9RHOB